MDGLRQAATAAKQWRQSEADEPDPVGQSVDGAETASLAHQRAKLACVIEGEIIPRLMMMHRDLSAAGDGPAGLIPPPVDVPGFARIVVKDEASVAAAYISVLRAGGRSIESILLDVLAPTARHLGELWEADLCDFVDVTLGLARLQQVLRDISPPAPEIQDFADDNRRVLLAPAPGEKHTFGISVVEQFFRLAGFDVMAGSADLSLNVMETLRADYFGLVGFSLSCETRLAGLAARIRKIRRESRNPSIAIMVGGPLLLQKPDLLAQIGADATAVDGPTAVMRAQNLLAVRARRC